MPLRVTRRAGTTLWQITGTVAGQRVRQSAGTAERRLAQEAATALEAKLYRAAVHGARAPVPWDVACSSYLDAHPPRPTQAAALLRISTALGRRDIGEIDQAEVDRLCAMLCRPGAAPATLLRQVIGPVRAVLMHAARRRWCDPPLLEVPAGATGLRRTRWLTPDEFLRLRDAAAPHLRPLLTFLVCTGARLGEALALDWRAVDLRYARVVLPETKGGERDRPVDLPPAAVAALATLTHREGRVFRPPAITRCKVVIRQPLAYRETDGTGGGQIATAWNAACRRAGLLRDSGRLDAEGQPVMVPDASPHTLRHTWASWRYAAHRDLLRLKDEGGWSSVSLVERYAKLVPPGMVPEIRAVWGAPDLNGSVLTQSAGRTGPRG